MKKEMIIAIVFGLMLGGGAAYALVQFPGNMGSPEGAPVPEPSIAPTETSEATSPAALNQSTLPLEILLPENQTFTQDAEVTVSGMTKSGSLVAISTPIDEKTVTAGEDGSFSERVALEEGSNELLVISRYNGLEMEKRIIVNYTKEEF